MSLLSRFFAENRIGFLEVFALCICAVVVTGATFVIVVMIRDYRKRHGQ